MNSTLIDSMEFGSQINHERSSGLTPLGKYKSTMDLYKTPKGGYFIEWDIPDLDEGVEIGLEMDFNNVVGYDGVMSIPEQAIELLKRNGFNTDEIEG